MEAKDCLYCSGVPSHLGASLFSCQASRLDEGELSVGLYDKCLVESNGKCKQSIIFDF
mgnify:FL=1